MSLLDAGCGIGIETARIAMDHPAMRVTGLDRNAELLRIAQRRADPSPPNLGWLEADLTALDLPDASFDAIRSERVLMYLPDGSFEQVLDDLVPCCDRAVGSRCSSSTTARRFSRRAPRATRFSSAPATPCSPRCHSLSPADGSPGCCPSAACAASPPTRSRSSSTSSCGAGSWATR
jgi:SAM-dependent methyltransferase